VVSEIEQDRTRPQAILLIVRSHWNVGPRTAGWDRLWHAIIRDVGPLPTTDAREPLESESGDG
jgi:hypothetical protein